MEYLELKPIWFNKKKRHYRTDTAREVEQQFFGAIICNLLALDRWCFKLKI